MSSHDLVIEGWFGVGRVLIVWVELWIAGRYPFEIRLRVFSSLFAATAVGNLVSPLFFCCQKAPFLQADGAFSSTFQEFFEKGQNGGPPKSRAHHAGFGKHEKKVPKILTKNGGDRDTSRRRNF